MREGVILSAGVLLLGIIVEGLIRMDAVPGLGDVDVISEAVASVSWISALPEPVIDREGRLPRIRHEAPTVTTERCSLRIRARHLSMFSTATLQEAGLSGETPLVVLADGKPLQHRSSSSGECTGQYSFPGNNILLKPPAGQEGASLTLQLQDGFPVDTADGPVWWIYAGTHGGAQFARAPQLAGAELTAAVVARRLPGNPPSPAVLQVAGQEVMLTDRDGELVATTRFTVPDEAWQLKVDSPRGGPHLQVLSLTLSGSGQHTELLQETSR